MEDKIYFHLPGLFSFYPFYKKFLPLYFSNKEYFFDDTEIGSVYGSPEDCLWGGGRVEEENVSPEYVLKLMKEYHIPAFLTFSNCLLKEEHLSDYKCNHLSDLFLKNNAQNGVIITSDLLMDYLKKKYGDILFVSSTTKVLTSFQDFKKELDNPSFSYIVADFRLNKEFENLSSLSEEEKRKTEFLVNENCAYDCHKRKQCYENVSRLNLGLEPVNYICPNVEKGGYHFSSAQKNPSFISRKDIDHIYKPMGFSSFKIEGRDLGSALLLEFILYYMVKEEYRLKVREEMYLENSLDLF